MWPKDPADKTDDGVVSQSPIQRGWLCGTANRGTANGSALSQSPIQRGWLCGPADKTDDGVVQPWASQSPIQRGWLCGSTSPVFMCLGLAGVSIPYPAGMALWRVRADGNWRWCRWVSIPYPAGMALWPSPKRCPRRSRRSQSPIQRGWLCGVQAAVAMCTASPVCLNPLSSGDGFVAGSAGTDAAKT